MQCEVREQREGESGGESFLLPCRGHLSQVRLSLPVNHRVETVLPPLRAEDAPCRSLCDSLCDSLSGHWVYGWPRAWSVLDVHGRSAWNPPLPSAPVGVSELQPVSPRKYRTVCVWQTIVGRGGERLGVQAAWGDAAAAGLSPPPVTSAERGTVLLCVT